MAMAEELIEKDTIVEGNRFLRLQLVLKVLVTWRRTRVMLLVAKNRQSDPLVNLPQRCDYPLPQHT